MEKAENWLWALIFPKGEHLRSLNNEQGRIIGVFTHAVWIDMRPENG